MLIDYMCCDNNALTLAKYRNLKNNDEKVDFVGHKFVLL